MSLNKIIIHESSASLNDVVMTFPVEREHTGELRELWYHFCAKGAVPLGARYEFVSQSVINNIDGDPCNWDFDYTNYDGIGSGSQEGENGLTPYNFPLFVSASIGYTGSL